MNKYIPTYVAKSVFDIDYASFYARGIKVILFDLDNTLATYNEVVPSALIIELFEKLNSIGFSTFIVSNNNYKRIKTFCDLLNISGFLEKANKPSINKIENFLNYEKNTILLVGDQILTDVVCSNRLNIESCLVSSISLKTQKWYTKINRLRENMIIKKIKKQNLEYGLEIEKIIRKEYDHE